MNELVVTVDTSTPAGSVALNRGDELLGEVLLHLRGTHTDRILNSLNWLLAEANLKLSDVQAFGVVVGPGSFTGLRVGIATVKGLAYAGSVPVVGVSSLETLAMQCPAAAFPVCAMIDARKSEVYSTVFDCQTDEPVALTCEQVLPPQVLLDRMKGDHLFIGSGATLYADLIRQHLGLRAHFVPWAMNPPRASGAAVIVLSRLRAGLVRTAHEIVPRYIRASEAEIMLASKNAAQSR
jgi:tRNA threonylcarbamoyladenosine biosynthesis protein TsaB